MPVVTKIVTRVHVYNEGYPEVKQQIDGRHTAGSTRPDAHLLA
jgi:hypothetical protein